MCNPKQNGEPPDLRPDFARLRGKMEEVLLDADSLVDRLQASVSRPASQRDRPPDNVQTRSATLDDHMLQITKRMHELYLALLQGDFDQRFPDVRTELAPPDADPGAALAEVRRLLDEIEADWADELRSR